MRQPKAVEIKTPIDVFGYFPMEPLTLSQLRSIVLKENWFHQRNERRELSNLVLRENGERLLGRGFWMAKNVWMIDDVVKKETFYVDTVGRTKIQKALMRFKMGQTCRMHLVKNTTKYRQAKFPGM